MPWADEATAPPRESHQVIPTRMVSPSMMPLDPISP